MPPYHRSCHCSAVRFEIDAEISDLSTRHCSICRKRNALMTSVHERRFQFVAGEDKLSLCQWNTGEARRYFCSDCGVYPFHRKRAMPGHYPINVIAGCAWPSTM